MTDSRPSAEHPARAASQASMAAVTAGDRSAWLALFADDAVVEDPIGPSMFDPDGVGHRGRRHRGVLRHGDRPQPGALRHP
ncbi:MAG: hypothetical protein R2704_11400 [Microthrixaceae bacterium]